MYGVARHDIRTVTGSNIALIKLETGLLDPVSTGLGKVKEELWKVVAIVADFDKWRFDYLTRLLTERGEAYYRAGESD